MRRKEPRPGQTNHGTPACSWATIGQILKALDLFINLLRVQLGLVLVAAIGASSAAESVVAIARGWKREDQSRRYRTAQRARKTIDDSAM